MSETPLTDKMKKWVDGGILQPRWEVVSAVLAGKLEKERALVISQLQRLHDAVSNCSLITGESQTLDIEREKLKARELLKALSL